ncbi:MAG: gliding motility-associated C-terminal domain-containing protein [Bacteroidetes bacterium]|nr:gliding motility-associated C-terminal domain-containing protein [Bacteroidota bacterium]
MNRVIRFFIIALLSTFVKTAAGQLTANAGPDKAVCPGVATSLGGTPPAAGGLAPYTYSWSPSAFLSSTTSSNPSCVAFSYVTYTLTITDDTGAVAVDQVIVSPYYITYVDAGNDTSICENSYALLGNDLNISGAGVSYTWLPTTFLDNNTLPRPTSTPLSSITYTLTATTATCPPKVDVVTVTIIPTPNIDAGPDITITEGEVGTLHGSGGFFYAWSPQPIVYYYTADPDVEPVVTTTYYLYGTDASNKCPNYDSVVVTVIPGDELVFYNTFTPNNDGNNDTWYIGNIYKYPNNKLEIYNRYGKLVFKTKAYKNTWNGDSFGETLPEGTYFYVLDLGDGKGRKNGTVTIIN